ncbi:uncharacterized protein LOC124493327 isoform X1 [Dermatophagoides farinae]|uniref:uncharacterized protein LOC124493327 isoform X1 n=1 Tax=Dermatophagoides farinae TaxID=6954 RepID=UPI003F5DD121
MDSSSQAEKRARLRRAKILTNSEDRMNRIFGVQSSQSQTSSSSSSSTTTTNRDSNISRDLPSSSPNTFDAHRSDYLSSSRQHNSPLNHSESTSSSTDSFQSQPHSCGTLPPRDESFPRKVSLISSPIHYKTLQQSQQFQRQQNSMLSMIFIWPLMYLMNVTLLLFVISCIGSYYSINFTTLFFTFESIHFVIGWLMNNNNNNNSYYSHNGNSQNRILNNRFTFGQFYKDFLLSIFCYIIIQATLMIKR